MKVVLIDENRNPICYDCGKDLSKDNETYHIKDFRVCCMCMLKYENKKSELVYGVR